MANKTLNARIVQKHDTQANWEKATGFIPKAGEVIVYDVDENYSYPRIKIGDGEATVSELPFAVNQLIGDEGQVISFNSNGETITHDLFENTYVDTLLWDGSIGNKRNYTNIYNIASGGLILGTVETTYVKVSDFVPSIDTFKLNPYSCMIYETGKEPRLQNFVAGETIKELDGYYKIAGENIMVVYSPNTEFQDGTGGTSILETGLYYSITTTTMTIGATSVTESRTSDLKVFEQIFPIKIIKEKLIPDMGHVLQSDFDQFSQTVVKSVNSILPNADGNVQIPQSDWDETDETSLAFIKNKPDEEDAMQILAEMNLIDPVTDENGAIYTNENGEIFTL